MPNIYEVSQLNNLVDHIKIPKMIEISQEFPRPILEDVPGELEKVVNQAGVLERINEGDSVCITAGSRGVANINTVVKEVVNMVKARGATPFVIPAMGSHGGATAEGQIEMLASLGVTEEFLGCEIRSSMETITLGYTPVNNLPVYVDKYASEADHTILINRIKPHPSFSGLVESGITKMAVIGVGKQKGASLCHEKGIQNMSPYIQEIGSYIFEHGNVIFGVGLVENAFDETCELVCYPVEKILEEEPAALQRAYANQANICFQDYDVLIVDEAGKDISGAGMDTDMVGRYTNQWIPSKNYQQVLVCLRMTEGTHGNATGMGLIDIAPLAYYEQLDYVSTYANLITSRVLYSAKMPMIMENDKICIQTAINSCVNTDYDNPKIVRIKNTLEPGRLLISEALIEEAKTYENVQIVGEEAVEMQFDADGNLVGGW